VARIHVATALAVAAAEGFTWSVAREDELVDLVAEVAPASRFSALGGMVHTRLSAGDPVTVTERLSARELAVLRLLPSHLGTVQLSQALVVSPNTVKTHVKSLYRKLGVTSRSEAVDLARQAGLLPLDRTEDRALTSRTRSPSC
jgi:DNA-binding NarL/FixJ family response regulator